MPCSPGMTACAPSCRHRAFIAEYRAQRTADEEARDASIGHHGPYSTEWAEYTPPPITLRQWLEQMKGWSS